MPVILTGIPSGITSRAVPTISAPASADFPSDVSNNQPDQGLLDKIASLLAHAGLLDVIGTYSAQQTFQLAGNLSAVNALNTQTGGSNGSAVRGEVVGDDVTKAGVKGVSSGLSPALYGQATGGGPALKADGPAALNGIAQVNAKASFAGGPNPSTDADKVLHAGLVCRGWARLAFSGTSTPTLQQGRNMGGPTSGGAGGFFSIDVDNNIGTDLDVQITKWDVGASDYGWDIRALAPTIVSGKTRINFRVVDPTVGSTSGKTPPPGTGCYVEVKSAN